MGAPRSGDMYRECGGCAWSGTVHAFLEWDASEIGGGVFGKDPDNMRVTYGWTCPSCAAEHEEERDGWTAVGLLWMLVEEGPCGGDCYGTGKRSIAAGPGVFTDRQARIVFSYVRLTDPERAESALALCVTFARAGHSLLLTDGPALARSAAEWYYAQPDTQCSPAFSEPVRIGG